MPQPMIDRDRCKGCELCIKNCPQRILALSKEINLKGYFYARVAEPCRCIGCMVCAVICPDVAIKVGTNGVQYSFFEY